MMINNREKHYIPTITFALIFTIVILSVVMGIKSDAEEIAIDAVKADPYTYKIDADKTGIVTRDY